MINMQDLGPSALLLFPLVCKAVQSGCKMPPFWSDNAPFALTLHWCTWLPKEQGSVVREPQSVHTGRTVHGVCQGRETHLLLIKWP